MSALNCMGGCGRPVTHEGKWCAECWFPPEPVSTFRESSSRSGLQIREEILRAAFVLRFGTTTEQAEALETLSHNVTVLHHSQTNP